MFAILHAFVMFVADLFKSRCRLDCWNLHGVHRADEGRLCFDRPPHRCLVDGWNGHYACTRSTSSSKPNGSNTPYVWLWQSARRPSSGFAEWQVTELGGRSFSHNAWSKKAKWGQYRQGDYFRPTVLPGLLRSRRDAASQTPRSPRRNHDSRTAPAGLPERY
jgi:hypothetical protein